MAPSAVPDLSISGLSLGPEPQYETSGRRTERRPQGTFNSQAFAERQQPICSEDTSVYGSRLQKGQLHGQHQRRSWYKPGKVPDAQPSGQHRHNCPWRWKNLCKAAEEASSGSMCPGHKLRVCHKLAGREDLGNVAKIAQQATLGAWKSGLLHEAEQTVLTGNNSQRPMQRPSSAPGRQPHTQQRPSSAPSRHGSASSIAVTSPIAPTFPFPSQNMGTAAPQRQRPQSAGNARSSQQAQQQQQQLLSTSQRQVMAQQRQTPSQRPQSASMRRPQSANGLRSSGQQSGGPRARPMSASLAPSAGSAMRVGSNPSDIERKWKHWELRTHAGAHGFKENLLAWEEHLNMRSQGVNNEFDTRLQMLERNHRLPTPSQQDMQMYSLEPDTGLPI